jgi:hypothetical protein
MISAYCQTKFSQMNKWFSVNKLSLTLDKTIVLNITTENLSQYPLNIGYNDKYIEKVVKP